MGRPKGSKNRRGLYPRTRNLYQRCDMCGRRLPIQNQTTGEYNFPLTALHESGVTRTCWDCLADAPLPVSDGTVTSD